MLSDLRDELNGSKALNFAMQDFLREWSAVSGHRDRATLLDQSQLPWFAELNRGLADRLDDEGFKARLRTGARQLQDLAREIVATARRDHPGLDAARIEALLPHAGPMHAGSMLLDFAA